MDEDISIEQILADVGNTEELRALHAEALAAQKAALAAANHLQDRIRLASSIGDVHEGVPLHIIMNVRTDDTPLATYANIGPPSGMGGPRFDLTGGRGAEIKQSDPRDHAPGVRLVDLVVCGHTDFLSRADRAALTEAGMRWRPYLNVYERLTVLRQVDLDVAIAAGKAWVACGSLPAVTTPATV